MQRVVLVVAAVLACGPTPATRIPLAPIGSGSGSAPIAVAEDAAVVPYTLVVLPATLATVRERYIDQARLVPRTLMVAALEAVEGELTELIVEPGPTELVVTVNDKQRGFALADLDTDAKLLARLADIFGFVRAHANPGVELAKLEYAAMNGILESLDPHSELMDPIGAREMTEQISGKYGGVGFVTEIRTDQPRRAIGISSVYPDGPGARAQLLARDRILAINGEPTTHMTLDDAVARLKGDPGTAVTLTIERDRSPERSVTLVRAVITQVNTSGRLIAKRVGYIKLDAFSTDVSIEVGRLMDDLRREGAKAWILDLRNNDGGLVTEAVKLVDRFVDKGTVVSTVGPAPRRDHSAGASELDDRAPLFVLVNERTISAAEIAAGALKYLERAVLIGTTTFGKGSVQTLFDIPNGSQLKLTVAQYLTAKGISIQSVGIVPDIEVQRLLVPKQLASSTDRLQLAPPKPWNEARLAAHLTSVAVVADTPTESVRFVGGGPDDYAANLAADLALAANGRPRAALIKAARAVVARRTTDEAAKLATALATLGIDWTAGPHTPATLTATFSADRPTFTAGDVVTITGVVTNTGTAPAYQVRARATSDDDAFDGAELAFGRIDPGASRRATVHVATSKASDSRTSMLAWTFDEHHGTTTAAPLALAIAARPRPRFAYAYHLVDDNDGLVQAGDRMRLHLRVKNVGTGRGPATSATLKSAVADRILVGTGFADLAAFEPGQTREVEFAFRIRDTLDLAELRLELEIADAELLDDATETITLRVNPLVPIAPASGAVALAPGSVVRAAAGTDAAFLATVRQATVVRLTGRSPSWVRIELRPGRPGFVLATAITPSTQPMTTLEQTWQATPPTLTIVEPPRATTAATVRVGGTAHDDTRVEDIHVMVYNPTAKVRRRKVFYQSTRNSKVPTRAEFATDVPLEPGSNAITVIARESAKVQSIQTFWVTRN